MNFYSLAYWTLKLSMLTLLPVLYYLVVSTDALALTFWYL